MPTGKPEMAIINLRIGFSIIQFFKLSELWIQKVQHN